MKAMFASRVTESYYDVVTKTPLNYATKLSKSIGADVYLKREDLQSIHSFKLRGAYNRLAHLSPEEQQRGVIAASAGNHAQGVAKSAQMLGISAVIVMPTTTPQIKVDAVRGFGAEVVLYGDSYSDAQARCQQIITESGRVNVHPFDDEYVIAGQGMIADEIVDQLSGITHVFVPVGGGGLIAGMARRLKAMYPNIKVIGVEPHDSNAMQQSLAANERVGLDHVGIFADGVAVKQVGELTFRMAQEYVDDIVTVSTDELCAAIKSIFEDTRAIVEPAGALAVAGACRYAEVQPMNETVSVAICSGANMSFDKLQFIAERTLVGSGKEVLLSVKLPEVPGALHSFCRDVINGHSITEFNYRFRTHDGATIFVGINVGDPANKAGFFADMASHNYTYTDLSEDEIAKTHIRHMVGGPGPDGVVEHTYDITFPERPGALNQFLQSVGDDYNISMFHYRGLGGDSGRVLIGFQTEERHELERHIQTSGYDFVYVASSAAKTFL